MLHLTVWHRCCCLTSPGSYCHGDCCQWNAHQSPGASQHSYLWLMEGKGVISNHGNGFPRCSSPPLTFAYNLSLFICHSLFNAPPGGGGYLGQFLLGMCRWPLRTPTSLWSILWPSIDPVLVTFGRESSYF